MKFYLCLSICAVVLMGGALAEYEEYKEMATKCMEQNNITEDEFEAIPKGEDFDPETLDERFKCFTHCMVEDMGYLDETGKLDLSKLEQDERVTQEHMDAAIKCKAENEFIDEPCEYSFKMMTCALDAMM
ncbi:general odorant-binding protein 57c [Musca domestica]|uniref:General odorant-binding protein 57c-like n=1 Tax=Musca domestica TaxID=7370 RepID=A0A1I8N0P6_MUSDO|nr:general odorant-binding protein 57c [Musca domestica]